MSEHSCLHIGMRKVKSLIAIIIGFCIWQAIRLLFPDLEVHPLYIYIYSFLEVRDTSEKTKTLGMQRIRATFVGIALGLPMLFLRIWLHSRFESEGLLVALDLAMVLVGVLAALQIAPHFRCGAMTGIAAVVYIILLIYHADDGRYLYALLRASQTLIGVFVAWIVNVWMFPYHGNKE
ncbi:MAG: FUSC family protein [Oscillospiraceae bacterium]|nr:FUSC family protein [Oscillospiraceae bacterium]